MINEELPHFGTECSPGGDAAYVSLREAVIPICGETRVETQTKQTAPITVLDVDEGHEAPQPFTLEEFLQDQKGDRLFRERAESVGEPYSCFDYD